MFFMNYNVLNQDEIAKNPFSRIVISRKCTYHYHSFFEFTICTKGSYKNFINDEWYEIPRGRILLLRPQDRHYFEADGRHTFRDVYVPIPVMESVCASIDPMLYQRILNTPLLIDFFVSDFQLQQLENKLNYFNNPQGKSDLSLNIRHRNVVTELLDLWQQNIKQKLTDIPDWLSILITQLGTEKFLNKNIEELIASTNYSHGYVCREFKKYMGKTIQSYINESRFSYSLSLLASRATVAQVAEKLGYAATSNFIIAFKNKFGTTPAQWRKTTS
jgi:AraC family cel operon transcriptional repressor